MAIDDIKDSTKEWLNSRLKNPYFAAVITVWVVTNRVIIYSIFNFDDKVSLDEKLLFIHTELQKFNRFEDWFYIPWNWIKGFWGTVVWSFICGFFTMVGIDLLNGFGKMLFKLGNRVSNKIIRWVKDDTWVSVELHDKLNQEKERLAEDLSRKRSEINLVQDENEKTKKELKIATDTLEKNLITLSEFKAENSKIQSELSKAKSEIGNLNKDKNSFKVTYAGYGTDDFHIEVTTIIRDIISNSSQFIVSNETFGHDPVRFAPKYLSISYMMAGQINNFKTIEGSKVLFVSNGFFSEETDNSKFTRKIIANLNTFVQIFAGTWTKSVLGNNKTETIDIVEITGDGKFKVANVTFDLFVPKIDDAGADLTIVDHSTRDIFAQEQLKFTNDDNVIVGKNNMGSTVKYMDRYKSE